MWSGGRWCDRCLSLYSVAPTAPYVQLTADKEVLGGIIQRRGHRVPVKKPLGLVLAACL